MPLSPRKVLAVLAGTGCALAAAPSAAQAAEALYGLTDQNRIVRFNADGPGNPLSSIPIQGLAQNEVVVAVDVRPANDHLYAVTNQSRLYQVDPATGETRLFGAGPFTPGLNGTTVGADVNPVADALRLTTDTEQNLRLRFSDGNVFTDGNLTYAPGDPGAGTDPAISGVAYTNSLPGATETSLVGIDSARDALVLINPPNAGTLTTIGALGVDAGPLVGFDIAANGNVAYAAFQTAGTGPVNLHRIDLQTGRATPAAEDPALRVEGQGVVRGIATAGTVPDDDSPPQASVAFSSTILEQNTDVLEPSVSCNETCTVSITVRIGNRTAGSATETIVGAGRETVEVRMNATARRTIERSGTELLRLAIRAEDAAGNATSQNRVSRTQTLSGRRG